MSESVKPRFAVDLTEIERQLAQAGSPQAQPASATRNDPLAELARIVGQEDPFQAILANDGATRPRQQPSAIDDLFAARDTVTPASRAPQGHGRQVEPELPAFDLEQFPQVDPRSAGQSYAYQQAAPSHQQVGYGNEAYADDYYDDNAGAYASEGYGHPERLDYPPVERARSRKGLIAVAAVVGAVVIGGGGAYLMSGSSVGSGGEPPLVMANEEPVKVQPQNPGGVEIPNQNKQIYERAQQTETKMVNREEQPVDVAQAVRMNGGAVADATGATVPGASTNSRHNANSLNLGEPRKVRTVSIRPDGSMVGAPESNAARSAASSPVPSMSLPAEAQPSAAAHSPSNGNVQVAAAQPKPAASTPVAAPATPAVAPKPAPAAATPAAAQAPQRVASTQPVPVAAPAATPETTTTAAGGFSVQLGLANSEAGAETAFTSYQRKYPDLEGMPSLIRKAEVNGNTIYRVRVGPMTREEASSLCSKLQGQGGQCFVAKN